MNLGRTKDVDWSNVPKQSEYLMVTDEQKTWIGLMFLNSQSIWWWLTKDKLISISSILVLESLVTNPMFCLFMEIIHPPSACLTVWSATQHQVIISPSPLMLPMWQVGEAKNRYLADKHCRILTHLPLDKMAAISQTIFLNAFSWMNSFVFQVKFHWSLFLRVQLTIT